MQNSKCKITRESGVTLIEVAVVVLIVGFLALLISNLPSSIASINKSRHSSMAREITSRELEALRKQGFANLTLTESPVAFVDSNLSSLLEGQAVYEVLDCPASICSLGEEVKQVKVKVSWNESGDEKVVELITLITEGGI